MSPRCINNEQLPGLETTESVQRVEREKAAQDLETEKALRKLYIYEAVSSHLSSTTALCRTSMAPNILSCRRRADR